MTIPISVVIPVYRNVHLLNDSLQSLKSQTFQGFEIVVINDGSPEVKKIKKILKQYKKLLNIKYIGYKKNK